MAVCCSSIFSIRTAFNIQCSNCMSPAGGMQMCSLSAEVAGSHHFCVFICGHLSSFPHLCFLRKAPETCTPGQTSVHFTISPGPLCKARELLSNRTTEPRTLQSHCICAQRSSDCKQSSVNNSHLSLHP